MKVLGELLERIETLAVFGETNVAVTGIAHDSRTVKAGDLFVALAGRRLDGAEFAAEAVRRGAVAVVGENSSPPANLDAPYVAVRDASLALSQLSAALYDYPARQLGVIGVTGTDGKTTTVRMVSALLTAAGVPHGRISTVDIAVGPQVRPNDTNHTTPQAPAIHRMLREMVEAGAPFAVLEASSHALALNRVADCEFDIGVFTNLTPEHLDFHKTVEEYRQAKARLFHLVGRSIAKPVTKATVVNVDDPNAGYFARCSPVPVITYGIDRPADVRASDIAMGPGGTCFTVRTPGWDAEVVTGFVGRFNVYNWLAAIAVGVALGIDAATVVRAASSLDTVPGRLQPVDQGQPFAFVVDFAHTPNALAQVLATLRPLTSGRLIVVFGHAGERDRQNRPLLGATAARGADFSIVTLDDSYGEDPQQIIADIEEGLLGAGARPGRDYIVIPEREEAIREATSRARAGDTVLVAGRGHERYLIAGGRRVEFDDAEVGRRALAAQGYTRTPRAA